MIETDAIKTLIERASFGFAMLQFIFKENSEPIDFKFVEVNPVMEQMMKLSRKQLLGKTFKTIWSLTMKDSDYWIQTIYNHYKEQNSEPFEYHSSYLGKVFKIQILSLEKDFFSAFVMDITLEKHRNDQLSRMSDRDKDLFIRFEQMEKEYKKLYTAVEQGPTIVVITDYDGNLEYTNKKFQTTTGYSFEEVKGKNPRFLNSGHLPKSLYETLWGNLKSGKSWSGTFHNKRKNGELYWEEGIISPVFDETGRIVNFVKISQDVTGLKEAQEELKKSRERLKTIINNLPGYLVVLDEHLQIILANNSWMDAMAKKADTPEENAIKKIATILSAKKESVLNTARLNRLKNGKTIVKINRSDTKSFKIMLAPIKNEDGRLTGIVEYAIDITELEEAKVKAQDGNRAKGEFLAQMSHEIRTPLNAVIGFSDILKRTVLNDVQRKYLENIKFSADSLMEIINDILDFSKIENRKLRLNPEPVNIIELFEKTIELMRATIRSKTVTLSLKKEGDIPEFLEIDLIRIRQIITNLLSNAIKFTEEGEVILTIAYLGLNRHGKADIKVSVKDTGIGISKEHVGKIFEAFSQADPSTTKRFGGTGLGLAITNQLLEMMNSHLNLKSEPGKGSDFSFILSLNPAEKDIAQSNDSFEQTIENTEKSDVFEKPTTIMIVEDNALNLEMAHIILSNLFENGTIITANNGENACVEYERHFPQLIFMDIQLPHMDGFEATKNIRKIAKEQNQSPFIVALTATSLSFNKGEETRNEFDAFMIKPVTEDNFKKAIHRYCHQSKAAVIGFDEVEKDGRVHFNQKLFFEKMGNDKEAIDHITRLGKSALEDGEKSLKKAFVQKNMTAIKKIAHQMKGMALNMHFEILLKLTVELERVAEKADNIEQIKNLYEKTRKEIKQLRKIIV